MPGGRSRAVPAAACIAVLLACLVGCGGGADHSGSAVGSSRPASPGAGAPSPETVAKARCPADAGGGCRSATGQILYVERNDPDGDGDAHFVILDRQGITFRGLTSIDVRAGLRPNPLPGPGDLVSAAGPVQTGSFGQDQIHALVLHVGSPD